MDEGRGHRPGLEVKEQGRPVSPQRGHRSPRRCPGKAAQQQAQGCCYPRGIAGTEAWRLLGAVLAAARPGSLTGHYRVGVLGLDRQRPASAASPTRVMLAFRVDRPPLPPL